MIMRRIKGRVEEHYRAEGLEKALGVSRSKQVRENEEGKLGTDHVLYACLAK